MSNRDVAKAYSQPTAQGGNPRETEGRALLEAARRMAEAQKCPDDRDTLRAAARLNWRLWTIFQSEVVAPDCELPREIRQNMINLCNFVDKRTVDILAQPEPQKVDVLININRQIAAGLLTNPKAAPRAEEDAGKDGPRVGNLAAVATGGFSI